MDLTPAQRRQLIEQVANELQDTGVAHIKMVLRVHGIDSADRSDQWADGYEDDVDYVAQHLMRSVSKSTRSA